MTAGSRSSPAITSAGSPGSRCCSVKIMIDTKNSVGISCTMRRARKFSMMSRVSRARRSAKRCDAEAGPGSERRWVPALRGSATTLHRVRDTSAYPCPSLELQPDHAHQPVRHLPVAFELRDMRDQPLAMVEIDDRLVIEHDPGQLLIDRLALCGIGDETRVFHQLVGFRVGIAAVVLRRAAMQKDVGVAVGIDAAAPVDLKHLKISGRGVLERGGEFVAGD